MSQLIFLSILRPFINVTAHVQCQEAERGKSCTVCIASYYGIRYVTVSRAPLHRLSIKAACNVFGCKVCSNIGLFISLVS